MPTPDAPVCGACLTHPHNLHACYAAVDFAPPWTSPIHAFKFGEDPSWARHFSKLMQATPGVTAALEAASFAIPTPLSRERLRERGYNQSLLLAQRLAPDRTLAHALHRLPGTRPQRGLKRAERLHNMKDAFAVEPSWASSIAGQHGIIVDDVMTTGATLQAMAAALRMAGAQRITAIVFARA